ncbi:MAG: DUF3394 domain-containing protein, partial [Pseudomonadota bacterium]
TFMGAIFVFCISLIAMLLFAAVTQGYFISKSRMWESAVLLLVVFLLFRPDYFLDQVSEKYRSVTGPAALTAIGESPVGEPIRLVITGPDFDTAKVGDVTIQIAPEAEGDGLARLDPFGLAVLEDGDTLTLEEPFPGTPFFEQLANGYDFYGDTPVTVSEVLFENERMPKEVFFIPGLLLMLIIAALQWRRKTQAPF